MTDVTLTTSAVDWRPGDECASCGSRNTGWNAIDGGFCRSCHRQDSDES